MKSGTPVICIDDKFPAWVYALYANLPKEGIVYHIRSDDAGTADRTLRPGQSELDLVVHSILLQELSNPIDPTGKSGKELGFNSDRFREVDELKNFGFKEELEPVELVMR